MAAFVKLETLRMLRNGRYVTFTVAVPLGFYLLFATIYGGAALQGVPLTAYFMVSMATYAAMGAALSAGGARLAAERANGWTRLLRVTPLPPAAYLLAKVAAGLAAALPAVLVVAVAAATVHHVALPAGTWLAVVLASWLGVVPFAALGLLLGFVLDSDSAYGGTLLVYFALAVCGGMWTPLPLLPPAMRAVGRWLPSYHLAQMGWDVLAGHGIGGGHVLVLLAYTLGFSLLVVWRYRRDQGREYA